VSLLPPFFSPSFLSLRFPLLIFIALSPLVPSVIACGLSTLEVTANSYVTVMPPSGAASFRLQFSQSFNGVASFSGPLIASKYFFSAGNSDNLTNVQFVYMAVAGLGVALAIVFFFTKLPEVSEADLQAEQDALAESSGAASDPQLAKPFRKQIRPILGALCQFM
jgi:FHS family L-fucose permease-like MFS transporter